jgi:hypothetical protein
MKLDAVRRAMVGAASQAHGLRGGVHALREFANGIPKGVEESCMAQDVLAADRAG